MKEFDHISTNEIQQDIADTQAEIDEKNALLAVYRRNPPQYKKEIIFAESGISQRQVFIDKLKAILTYRGIN